MDLLSTVLVPLAIALVSWMLLDARGRTGVRPEPVRVETARRRRGGR